MTSDNVPAIIQQIRDNMMDTSTPVNIRFNYRTTLENIRNFCDKSIAAYERQQNGKKYK